ncbi:uncharacterized protein CDAR_58561 [Caerostris darwini]|uniref:Uncharacterized protein n=1 Tax=Caerostris darwini TaxID=1538125 RepID=A0AAV4U794_9ARAC|nr:uncharacterized protein CDAR_58561 [Caerostris darwini]
MWLICQHVAPQSAVCEVIYKSGGNSNEGSLLSAQGEQKGANRNMNRLTRLFVRMLLLAGIVLADPPRMLTSSSSSLPTSLFSPLAPPTVLREGCPRKEDIHPCECLEIPKPDSSSGESGIETVAFCKTIRNTQVLQNAMKGMQGHTIDFMVLDSCKLPPFPNGLFFNVGIKWMEILNSTVQLKQNFFECASNCW